MECPGCLPNPYNLLNSVMTSPNVRGFAKDIIRKGMTLDPVDAIRDVTLALEVLESLEGLQGSPLQQPQGGKR